MKRELKFEFVFRNPNSKEVIISAPYTLNEIRDCQLDDIRESCLVCDCEPIGETNVVECNCEDYYDQFEEIAIRQYTGIQDQTSKEIYEGDIIKGNHPNCFMIVRMLGGLSLLNVKFLGQDHNELVADPINSAENHSWLSNSIVVGNIYENPKP